MFTAVKMHGTHDIANSHRKTCISRQTRIRQSSGDVMCSVEGTAMAVSFILNRKQTTFDGDPSEPLLWTIREWAGLTGTKFGCGIAQCGACTVHLDGRAIRSCVMTVSAAAGKAVTTIEGVSGPTAIAVQTAWEKLDVVQCGYCQSGQIMSAIALLHEKPNPTDVEIDAAMSGNICRCGTYVRIRAAIHEAAQARKT
jgi:isoquinoline 1-oxidoreductase subunit alpha